MAHYRMYIDDLRDPKTDHDLRSVQDAQNMIAEVGCPDYISFDHDLGENVPTGYDFAKWLVFEWEDGHVEFNVHSANPVGVKNIT